MGGRANIVSPTSILEIQNLSYAYDRQVHSLIKTKEKEFRALQDVSFSVEKGEIFGLLGPNGGGKTTLFRILSTYFVPAAGSVRIFGSDIRQNSQRVRQQVGVVFQSPSLDKKLTVAENLIHQGHLYGLAGKRLNEKIAELLARVGLSQRTSDRVETLSGGLQRRAEIAKGMLHAPELLLMDEPSTGLDPGARRDLWDYLQELKKMGITILITTHLMEEAEKCDRLAILNLGWLVALGTPSSLKQEIGGDVITVETQNPEKLADLIQKKFSLHSIILENALRIETDRGPEFVPQLLGSFAGEILSVTVGKPTLEDVFIHKTGHKFWHQASQEQAFSVK